MQIIAHRINTIKELQEVPEEYGVEIDIRAHNGKIILNHEPFEDGEELEEWLKHFKHKLIIFNVKETGMEEQIIELAEKYNVPEYFFLDIEKYATYKLLDKGFKKIAVRFSILEPVEYVLKHNVDWVYVEGFGKYELTKENYKLFKEKGYKICMPAPELLGKPEEVEKWRTYFEENDIMPDAVMTKIYNVDKWKN